MNLYAQPQLPYGAPGAAGSIYGGGGGSFQQSQQLYPTHQPQMSLAKIGRRESTTSYFAANAIAAQGSHQNDYLPPAVGHYHSQSNASSPRAQSPNSFNPPTNEQLHQDTMEILSRSDLQTLTKKGVRQELERRYGGFKIEGEKKTFVNRVIGEALGLQ